MIFPNRFFLNRQRPEAPFLRCFVISLDAQYPGMVEQTQAVGRRDAAHFFQREGFGRSDRRQGLGKILVIRLGTGGLNKAIHLPHGSRIGGRLGVERNGEKREEAEEDFGHHLSRLWLKNAFNPTSV